jgi:hypothetical protein
MLMMMQLFVGNCSRFNYSSDGGYPRLLMHLIHSRMRLNGLAVIPLERSAQSGTARTATFVISPNKLRRHVLLLNNQYEGRLLHNHHILSKLSYSHSQCDGDVRNSVAFVFRIYSPIIPRSEGLRRHNRTNPSSIAITGPPDEEDFKQEVFPTFLKS